MYLYMHPTVDYIIIKLNSNGITSIAQYHVVHETWTKPFMENNYLSSGTLT